jgi:predicted amidohydrolase YtcJ
VDGDIEHRARLRRGDRFRVRRLAAEGGRPPTAEELDEVSRDLPVFVIHQSGHLGAYNSAALRKAGITADTPDPKGGAIRRKPGSREPTARWRRRCTSARSSS